MADYAHQVSIAPYCRFAAVTPNDNTDLSPISEAIMVGATGDVVVNDAQGNTITLKALQVGVIYPFRVARIKATGTTATNIVQLFKGV
jgi:hypothetical protein